MFKQKITYQGFDGETLTDTLYFNLNRIELAELTAKYGGVDMEQHLTDIESRKDIAGFYGLIKDIALTAFGLRSEDGKKFLKNEEIRNDFLQSLVFGELIEQFHDGEGEKMEEFIKGILKNIRGLKESDNRPPLATVN